MFIYEVNLTVDADVASEFSAWLREHIRKMLTLDGFEAAAWYARSDDGNALPDSDEPTGPRQWTVHYQVESRKHLRTYLDTDAEPMRQDALDRFEDRFSADRRILEQQRIFSRHNPDRVV